jgi:hypothetical protein
MPGRLFALFAALLGLAFSALATEPALAGSPDIVLAQAGDAVPTNATSRRHNRRPTRITVYPNSRLQRDCRAWYEVQHRPSGDVIYPQINCQWTVR